MNIENINSELINWDKIEAVETKGETGFNTSKEFRIKSVRIRLAEYSPDYITDEWCSKGHIIHCIEGEINILFKDGGNLMLNEGKSAILREGDLHKAITKNTPAKIFIVD